MHVHRLHLDILEDLLIMVISIMVQECHSIIKWHVICEALVSSCMRSRKEQRMLLHMQKPGRWSCLRYVMLDDTAAH